jgi:hypothetical protein
MKCPKCHFENPEDTLYCGKCGARLLGSGKEFASPTETLLVPKKGLDMGSTFASRYQVIEEVGKGGMGRVYKVFDKEIEEKVALKLLKPEIASDELGRYSYLPPLTAYPKGVQAAERALGIDKTLGEAHTSLAFIKRYYNFERNAAVMSASSRQIPG